MGYSKPPAKCRLACRIINSMLQSRTQRMVSISQPHSRLLQSSHGLKSILCIFWSTFGFLRDRLLEKKQAVSSYVYYHKLIQVADKCRSHYKCAFVLGRDFKKKSLSEHIPTSLNRITFIGLVSSKYYYRRPSLL